MKIQTNLWYKPGGNGSPGRWNGSWNDSLQHNVGQAWVVGPSWDTLAWKSDLDHQTFLKILFLLFVYCCAVNLTSPSNSHTACQKATQHGPPQGAQRRVDYSAWIRDFFITPRRRWKSLGSSVFAESLLFEPFSCACAALVLHGFAQRGWTTSPFRQIATPRCFDWMLFKSCRSPQAPKWPVMGFSWQAFIIWLQNDKKVRFY